MKFQIVRGDKVLQKDGSNKDFLRGLTLKLRLEGCANVMAKVEGWSRVTILDNGGRYLFA